MGRPRDVAEVEAKRAALRRAAARLGQAGGFSRVTWEKVAGEVGSTPSVIKYYFGNLKKLLWSLAARHVEVLLARLGQAAPDTMPPRDRLLALAQAYSAVVAEWGPEHRAVLAYQHMLHQERHGDCVVMQRWVLQAFEDAVQAVLPDGDRRAMPLALHLLAMLNGQAHWFRENGAMQREECAGMAVRMVLSEAEDAGFSTVGGIDGKVSSDTLRQGTAQQVQEGEDERASRRAGADSGQGLPPVGKRRPARWAGLGVLGDGLRADRG